MKLEVKKSIISLVLSGVLLVIAYILDKTLSIPLWGRIFNEYRHHRGVGYWIYSWC